MNLPYSSRIIDRSDSMRIYLNQLKKTNTSSISDRDRLIVENHPLVVSIAAKYQHMGLEMEDLFSFGLYGLVQAVDHFNPLSGTTLATAALPWINGAICRGLSDSGHPIRLPQDLRSLAQKVFRMQDQFFAENEREATVDELADLLHTDASQIQTILDVTHTFELIDRPVDSEDDDCTLGDTVAFDDTGDLDNRIAAEILLRSLPPREREIIERRFLQEEEVRVIAHDMHLSAVRVRQIIHSVCPFWAD